MIPSKRMGRLEIKNADAIQDMAEAERAKKAEARKKWREENSESLRWEMFLRVRGPDGDWDQVLGDQPDSANPEAVATEAFRDVFKRILPKYKGFIEDVDFSKMGSAEKAFIICLDHYFWSVDRFDDLLSQDLDDWMHKLGYDRVDPPFDDLIEAVDKHYGGPDWREIYYHQEAQDEEMEKLRENYEYRRERRIRYRAEHPDEDF